MEDRKVKQVLSGGTSRRGKDIRKGCGRVNMVEMFCHMYENGKMRPTETILRTGKGGIKENDDGVNLTKIYRKYFCKCHNIPPA
jgi:hypothetical protein